MEEFGELVVRVEDCIAVEECIGGLHQLDKLVLRLEHLELVEEAKQGKVGELD